MATERLPMRHIREILRLKWGLKRSHREARSLGISAGAVASVLSRAIAIGLTLEALDGLTDDALEQRLYGPKLAGGVARPLPDPTWIHTELRRAGVTLELLHLEYLQEHPDGYRYSAFCRHYREWLGRQRLSMRHVHKAGDKLFVDYSGKTPAIVDSLTGVVRPVELFVAVLGASNYTYAEATETQRSADFIQSHGRTLEYLAGVPA
jgi:transposase